MAVSIVLLISTLTVSVIQLIISFFRQLRKSSCMGKDCCELEREKPPISQTTEFVNNVNKLNKKHKHKHKHKRKSKK